MEMMPQKQGPRTRHQNDAPGTPSLLPFAAMPAPGVMLNKNGSFMAGWRYQAPDEEALSTAYRNKIAQQLNRSFARLGSEWMLNIDAIRTPAPDYPDASENYFPDPVTSMIDEERRRTFKATGAAFTTSYTLVATYLPSEITTGKLSHFFYTTKEEDKHTPFEKALDDFNAAISRLEDDLSIVLNMQRLTRRQHTFKADPLDPASWSVGETDDLANHLRQTFTGLTWPKRLTPPGIPINMDYHIGAVELRTGLNPQLDGQTIAAIAIDDFPTSLHPAMLTILAKLGISCRWSTRFIFQDSILAEKKLKRQRSRWQGRVRGFFDQLFNAVPSERSSINQDAQQMVDQTDRALSELASNQVGYGHYSSCVILRDESAQLAAANARYISNILERAGFGGRVEQLNTLEAFLGSIPGVISANIRRPLLSTAHLSNLLPTSSVWPGQPHSPNPMLPPASPPLFLAKTGGTTPFNFNLHVKDVGHTLILGPTGSGKSTLLALIAAQFARYNNATITVFDKGRSMQVLTMAADGQCFDLEDNNVAGFAPLADIDDESSLRWAAEWVESLANLQGVQLIPKQREALHQALMSLQGDPNKQTITSLTIAIQDAELKEAIKAYSVGGIYEEMLDSNQDKMKLTRFSTIEIGELMNLDDKIKMPVLTYLFRQVERQAKGQPYLLILDEAWLMLSHPIFREKIREWLKTLRKSNVAVVLATQSLSDAARSGILDVLAESCPTKIYLPNAEANNPNAADQYKALGVLDEELEVLAGLTPKRQYFVASPEGKRIIDLDLAPITLAFIAASSPEEVTHAQELYANNSKNFAKAWLQHKNIQSLEAI